MTQIVPYDFFSCHIAVMCFPQSGWVSVEWPGRDTRHTSVTARCLHTTAEVLADQQV